MTDYERMIMTDYEASTYFSLIDLLDKNGIFHHETKLYKSDGSNELAGTAIWLKVGHVEFDTNGKITNIVNY